MNPEMDWQQLNAMGFQPMQKPEPNMSVMSPEQAALIDQRLKEREAKKMSMASGPQPLPFQPNKQMMSTTSTQMISDPRNEAMLADNRARFKQYLTGAEAAADRQGQQIDEIKNTPAKYDWTAAAGLADFLSGGQSNLTSVAKAMPGMSQDEKQQLLAKLQDQSTQRKENLANIVGQRINNGEALKMQQRLMEASDKNMRQDKSMDRGMFTQFNKDLRADVGRFQNALASSQNVADALLPDANGNVNAQRAKTVIPQALRSLGEVGALSDADVGRVTGKSTAQIIADLENFATGPSATIPASYMKPLLDAIQASQKNLGMVARKNVDRTKNTYLAGGMNPDLAEQIAGNIYGDFLNNSTQEQKLDPIQQIVNTMPKGK